MKRTCFSIIAVFTIATILLLSQNATAKQSTPIVQKGQGMDAHLFRAAVDTKGHFTVDATPILPHLAFSLGLTLDFGFHDWIAPEVVNEDIYNRTMLDTYIYSTLMFNLGIKDFLVVGFQIPLAIPSGSGFYGYDMETQNPHKRGFSSSGGIADIGLHLKLRWLRADRHPIGIGTVIKYHIPNGKETLLMGDPKGGALAAKLIFDAEPISWYRVALNAGVHLPLGALGGTKNYLDDRYYDNQDPTVTAPDDPNTWLIPSSQPEPGYADGRQLIFKYGPMATFGFANSFGIWPEVMDFVIEVYGSHLMTEMSNLSYFSMEASAGFKLFVERNSYLMAGYAHGIPLGEGNGDNPGYGFQSVEHRMFIGFAFEPSIGDRDGDGLKDDVDQCPDHPEDMDDFVDSDGCPDPDNDRDGILDVEDDCPLVPEDRDGDQDQDGCPEKGENDRDGDGILDDEDKCPDNPEDMDQFEDEDGCPDPDNDKDGILDVNDVCPNDPEDVDGWEDGNGCPDPDNDADRILDRDDSCPNDPETYNGKDDEDGCPDQGDVIVTPNELKILKKVYFEYDSAVIKRVSYEILDAVAATIINNPQIDKIEIQGHADERGDDKYNLNLTIERAASVVNYLTNKGVPEAKLSSQGYGEFCPIEDGHNEAAWEKNRRVEFKVLSIGGSPTGVRTSCDRAQLNGIGLSKQ